MPRINSRSPLSQSGFSLLEILLALFLTAAIIASLVQVYMGAHKSLDTQRYLTKLQQAANFAAYSLRQSLVKTGQLMDCSTETAREFWQANRVRGYRGWHTDLTMLDPHRVLANSDIVLFRYVDNSINSLINMPNKLTLQLRSQPQFEQQQTLVITDCEHSENLSVATIYHGNQIQVIHLDKPLQFSYQQAKVDKVRTNVFYIGKTDRIDEYGVPIMALWLYDSHVKRSDELVAGVEHMIIDYAMADGHYLPADKIIDWEQVHAIKLTVTLRMPQKEFVTYSWVVDVSVQ